MKLPVVRIAEPRLYTVKDAAAFFSMSASWVRERIRRGDLEAYLCGNLLVPGASINRYLAKCAVGPAAVLHGQPAVEDDNATAA